MNRSALRKYLRNYRSLLTPKQIESSSILVQKRLIELPIFQSSGHIAAYLPYKGEIDLTAVLDQETFKKNYYLPILTDKNTLDFLPYSPQTLLVKNRYQIFEPALDLNQIRYPEQIDLALLPLVAFDTQGNRIGQGGGYYDRSFAFLKNQNRPSRPYLLGLAYEWQKIDNLVPEEWDIPLDAVLTDENLYLAHSEPAAKCRLTETSPSK